MRSRREIPGADAAVADSSTTSEFFVALIELESCPLLKS